MASNDNALLGPDTAAAWRVLEALDEGIYTIDKAGNCLMINAAALSTLGYDRAEDLMGRNMHDLIHHTRPSGSAYPKAECPLLQTALGGHPVRLANETLWRRDGTPFLAEYSAFPIREGEGPIGCVVTFREEVIRGDARNRLAVQYAVSQQLVGSAGTIASVTGVLETIGRGFGWEIGRFYEHAGERLHITTQWPPAAGTDEIPVSETVARAWATGRAAHEIIRSGSIEISHVRTAFAFPIGMGATASGVIEFQSPRIIPLDESLLGSLEVLGQIIGQAIERHRTASALRASETRFRVIADALPQLSWMADPAGAITWYNQRWYDYTGTSFEKMSGWGWMAVQHPDHVERVERGFRASLASGEPWEDTFPLRAANGSYRWFLSRALPFCADPNPDAAFSPGEGPIAGWFGSNTDITLMREAEQSRTAALDEAKAANLAKSLFLANMSHELRTPLSAIIGYSEMLIEQVEDGEEPGQVIRDVIRDVGKIETNARHLLGLINDVLDLSKIESGKMEAYAETFEVASVVTNVAATVTTLIEKNGNRLEVSLAGSLGTMHSDVTRIRQMLLNLLSNAGKFCEKGLVILAASREAGPDGSDRIRFAVSDTGLGMTQEQLARLFVRFQQADASTTRKFGGSGLGLSLTKVFSRLLGGDVEVSSMPGQGSTFTLLIPATLPAPSAHLARRG